MRLLITGLPGTGKTTLIQKLIAQSEGAFWVVCAEVQNDQGQGLGFVTATSSMGAISLKAGQASVHISRLPN
jgi:nucleoside-triphosphatase THEP1